MNAIKEKGPPKRKPEEAMGRASRLSSVLPGRGPGSLYSQAQSPVFVADIVWEESGSFTACCHQPLPLNSLIQRQEAKKIKNSWDSILLFSFALQCDFYFVKLLFKNF